MPEAVAKANLLGSTINNWMKIGGIVLAIIGGAYLTYYQIQSNTAANERQDTRDKIIEETIAREIKLWGERSDKRNKRASGKEDELEEDLKALEQELEETKLDIAFMKGRQYEKDKNR